MDFGDESTRKLYYGRLTIPGSMGRDQDVYAERLGLFQSFLEVLNFISRCFVAVGIGEVAVGHQHEHASKI